MNVAFFRVTVYWSYYTWSVFFIDGYQHICFCIVIKIVFVVTDNIRDELCALVYIILLLVAILLHI